MNVFVHKVFMCPELFSWDRFPKLLSERVCHFKGSHWIVFPGVEPAFTIINRVQ